MGPLQLYFFIVSLQAEASQYLSDADVLTGVWSVSRLTVIAEKSIFTLILIKYCAYFEMCDKNGNR